MIKFKACPRCNGPVISYDPSADDGPLCITCGWRRRDVPPAVQKEVDDHEGKSFIEHTRKHQNPSRGKPPLSGWEREKRRRERERQRRDRGLNAS